MTTLLRQSKSHGTLGPFGKKGEDRFIFNVPADEIFDSCVLTIVGVRLSAGASIAAQPSSGATGALEVVVHWWHEGGSEVGYKIEAFSRARGVSPGRSKRVPGFLPSTRGFEFSNTAFAHRPDLILKTPFGNLELGDAHLGLCGGMVYAARDYFEARMPIPPGDTNPDSGPLFDFILHRLFDSFDIPAGVAKYLELMDDRLPDHETDLSRLGLAPHGRSWRMIIEEWPLIKADLDAGHLSPLGLVHVKSRDFTKLGDNHQVLAYGYDLLGDDLTLRIYDPNAPRNDNVTLGISLAQPDHTKQVKWAGSPVYSFFRSKYNFEAPPGFTEVTKVKGAFAALANGKLVCAENAGAQSLVANRDRIGLWETFEICIVGSNRVALKSLANNKFVCAEDAGKKPLIANRDQVGPWETFEIQYIPGNFIALKSLANGKFVCAEDAGARLLIANRDRVGAWEKFSIKTI